MIIFCFFIVALVLINKNGVYECLSLLPLIDALISGGEAAATANATGLCNKASRSPANICCTGYAGGIFGALLFLMLWLNVIFRKHKPQKLVGVGFLAAAARCLKLPL